MFYLLIYCFTLKDWLYELKTKIDQSLTCRPTGSTGYRYFRSLLLFSGSANEPRSKHNRKSFSVSNFNVRCREAGLPAVPSEASLGRDWCRIPRFPPQSAFRSDRSDQFTRSDSAGFGGLAAGAPPQMFPRCPAAVSRRQKWPIMSSRLANYYSTLQSVGRSVEVAVDSSGTRFLLSSRLDRSTLGAAPAVTEASFASHF